jgi:RNA polymerase sigma-70 factor (ECF subfamily)
VETEPRCFERWRTRSACEVAPSRAAAARSHAGSVRKAWYRPGVDRDAIDAGLVDAPDGEIVRRIAAGAQDAHAAEAELVRRFAPRVRLYGLRHLRDEDRALDLVQTVLVGVLVAARAGRVNELDRVDRFVLGTCRNVASRARDTEKRAELVGSFEEHLAPEVEHVDLTELMRCYAQLDDRARLVVGLSFHEERSADEVATHLGTTAGNVRVLRHRAVAALRRCLDMQREEAP